MGHPVVHSLVLPSHVVELFFLLFLCRTAMMPFFGVVSSVFAHGYDFRRRATMLSRRLHEIKWMDPGCQILVERIDMLRTTKSWILDVRGLRIREGPMAFIFRGAFSVVN